MRHRARSSGDTRHSVGRQQKVILSRKDKEFVSEMATTPSDVVADLYDASIDPSGWPHALLALGELAKADAVGLLLHDFARGEGHFERAIGIPADAIASYRRVHSRSNIWLQDEGTFRGERKVIRANHIVGAEDARSSPFFADWLQPIGLSNHLFAVVERNDRQIRFVVLARRDGKPDFEDAIVGEIETLLPALERALRVGRGVSEVRALERAALSAIEAMPIGVIMLDGEGVVVEANRSARAVLEAGEGLYIASGVLLADVGGRQVRGRDWLARTEKQGAGEITLLPVPRAAGKRPLTLLMLPLEEQVERGGAGGPVALLFVSDPERSVQFDQTRIARLYGLSRAESRVAALLASGYRLEQVAEKLDIAYETVRKHLKQIFGKTGTYRQAELVRMLVTGPAGLSL